MQGKYGKLLSSYAALKVDCVSSHVKSLRQCVPCTWAHRHLWEREDCVREFWSAYFCRNRFNDHKVFTWDVSGLIIENKISSFTVNQCMLLGDTLRSSPVEGLAVCTPLISFLISWESCKVKKLSYNIAFLEDIIHVIHMFVWLGFMLNEPLP